jgi:hypothetical protein
MRRHFSILLTLLLTALPAAAGYEWRSFPDEPAQVGLWLDGVQVGAYHLVDDYYRPLDPRMGLWGPRCQPPAPPPARNFGLVPGKIQSGEHFYLNGHEVSRLEVQRVLGAADPRIPDDAHRLHLTVIGEAAEREAVLADLKNHPALRPWHDRLAVKGYDADHWAVTRQGFRAGGRPTIYLQAPDGTVLHHQDDYQGGAENLAEALRRADPNYQPDNDPDRRRSGLLGQIPWSVPAAALAAVAVLFTFRRKS